jgi:P-type conjugative transfer protein TrbJ
MRHILKGTLGAVALFAATGSFRPAPAHAQFAVTCVNCSTDIQQLIGYAKQLQQVETQLQQYSTQLQQYANMVQNTVAIPQQVYSSAMSDMAQVRGLMSQGSQLSFSNPGTSMGTFSSFLSSAASVPANLTNQADQYAAWSAQAKDGITSAMNAVSAQNHQLEADNNTMMQLQSQAGSATGQMQAIQNSAEISAQGVRETEKLRQLMMVQIQLQANQQSLSAQQDAQSQAQWQNFVSAPPLDDAGTKY